jgi:hypothetical protein
VTTAHTIALLDPEEPASATFARTLDGLLPCSELRAARVQQGQPYRDPQPVALRSGVGDLVRRAERIDPSDEALEVELTYTGLPEQDLPVTVVLAGAHYNGGLTATEAGPLRVMWPARGPAAVDAHGGQGAPVATDRLFVEACGLQHGARPLAHAAQHTQPRWPSPIACSAVFHRDATQFARDLLLIRREYDEGVRIPLALGLPAPNAGQRTGRPLSERPSYYLQLGSGPSEGHGPPDGAAPLQFVQQLDPEWAERLAAASEAWIRARLRTLGKSLPAVRVYDHGDAGVAVCCDPGTSLWPLYEALA